RRRRYYRVDEDRARRRPALSRVLSREHETKAHGEEIGTWLNLLGRATLRGAAHRDSTRRSLALTIRRLAGRPWERNTGIPACAPSGHSVRFYGFSGVQLRWAHRL